MWGSIRLTTSRSGQAVTDIPFCQIRHPPHQFSHFVRDPAYIYEHFILTWSFSYDKVPLSAYVIADMLEIVDAHASHRFVIRDEEDEKIRILVSTKKGKVSFTDNPRSAMAV